MIYPQLKLSHNQKKKRRNTFCLFVNLNDLNEYSFVSSYFDPITTPYTTLIAPSLHPSRCPHPGRYTVIGSKNPNSGGVDPNSASGASNGGRKRRREAGDGNHGFTSDGPGI